MELSNNAPRRSDMKRCPLLLAMIFPLIASSSLALDPLFDTAIFYDAGDGSNSIIAVHFNEDGHLDMDPAGVNKSSDSAGSIASSTGLYERGCWIPKMKELR